ncbi:MAG TPA: patatin-like phospholipase family protein [Xanthobacteraceae bacterium]|jgi:NTE family protein
MTTGADPHLNAKAVNLALQGGGAHGAFVWGVLEEFLDDGRLSIEAISATSAGAMNAVVLAYGLTLGGREAAREKLAEFWREVAEAVRQIRLAWFPLDGLVGACGLPPDYYPSYISLHAAMQMFPAYAFNPLALNPLKDVLLKVVDFAKLNSPPHATRLFLNATNVRTGKIKVFETPAITVDAVLASACLPPYFQAIEIDGEYYWDGGYMGNPAIFPLIYRQGSKDVIVIHVNPIQRDEPPRTSAEIMHRINEISFNSSLMREMRAVAFMTRLIDQHELDEKRYNRVFIHWVGNDRLMAQLGTASQFYADWDRLSHLRSEGRHSARQWLEENFEHVGRRSTVDLTRMFL